MRSNYADQLEADNARFRALRTPAPQDPYIEAAQSLPAAEKYAVYVNRIEEELDAYTAEFFPEGYKKQQQWHSALSHVRRVLFPPAFMVRSNRGMYVDLDDLLLLYGIFLVYLERSERAGMAASAFGFSCLTGIHTMTINYWTTGKAGENWAAVLPDGTIYAGSADEDPPAGAEIYTYRQLAKDILASGKESIRAALMDTPVGNIALANHDGEIGLHYEKVQAPELSDPWSGSRKMINTVQCDQKRDLDKERRIKQLLMDI